MTVWVCEYDNSTMRIFNNEESAKESCLDYINEQAKLSNYDLRLTLQLAQDIEEDETCDICGYEECEVED